MKTKEFIKRVEELGYLFHNYKNAVVIYGMNQKYAAQVWKDKRYKLDMCSENIDDLQEKVKGELFDLLVEYARTPLDEREEEKKFYLKHRYFRFYNGSSKYLGMDLLKDKPDLYSKIAYEWVKNQFTLKEIEEIKKKFDTDLADFEIVEVEDED